MHLRRDEARLYREEADIRPNRYCARAMCLIAAVALLVLFINELGLFHVEKLVMRLGIGVALVALVIPQALVISERWSGWPGLKYIILGCISAVAMIVSTMLHFHATLVLLMPLLIAAQYPSRRLGWFAIGATMLCILLGSLFSLLIGTWEPDFLKLLLQAALRAKLELVVTEEWPLETILTQVTAYLVIPRMLVAAACGAVVLSINRHSQERMNATVQVLHMSESDALTELHNRRSYEEHLSAFPAQCRKTVACVYLDANGLHELNETQGHDAGDAMLCCVAEALRAQFGDEDTYRIGGDEFVALAADMSWDELRQRIDAVRTAIEEAGYSIAVGMEQNTLPCTMGALIRSAEAKMFSDKNRIYRETGRTHTRSGGEKHAANH